jgi:hypothetical protein
MAARAGLGKRRGRAVLVDVVATWRPDGDVPLLLNGMLASPAPDVPVAPDVPDAVEVTLASPLRLVRHGTPIGAARFRAGDLLENVVRRVSLLQRLYGDAPVAADFADLIARAQDAVMIDPTIAEVDGTRWSTHQGTEIPIGGLAGRLVLPMAGLEPLWPWLWAAQWAAQWLHAGKDTVQGLGAIRLRPLDRPTPAAPPPALAEAATPERFPRRVLVAAVGLAPQVVSETLWALTTRQRFVAAAIHLITTTAGDRKTMGFLGGDALSLFGRRQDRLSHVLVQPPFQNLPSFHVPPRRARDDPLPGGGRVRSAAAEVVLVDVPFVRLCADMGRGQVRRRSRHAVSGVPGGAATRPGRPNAPEPAPGVAARDRLRSGATADGAGVASGVAVLGYAPWHRRPRSDAVRSVNVVIEVSAITCAT